MPAASPCNLPARLLPAVIALLFWALPAQAFEPIKPIPRSIPYDRARALLGKQLFNDPVLSADRKVSCASCHDLVSGGDDGKKVSTGVLGRKGVMNSPTVFNTVFNFRQFWNGRAATLEEQAAGPLHNPVEMEMTDTEVEQRLSAIPSYRRAFQSIYGTDTVRFADVLDAIAEFEGALITPDSRFDRFLRHEISLDRKELAGYLRFKELGCVVCHNGINLGGNSFQKIGVVKPFEWQETLNDRYRITGDEYDKNVYKVPTLRNIELTAPYFHDGSKKTLEAALKAMATHNLGFSLSEEEQQVIAAFLKTLTGRMPEILQDDLPSAPADRR